MSKFVDLRFVPCVSEMFGNSPELVPMLIVSASHKM